MFIQEFTPMSVLPGKGLIIMFRMIFQNIEVDILRLIYKACLKIRYVGVILNFQIHLILQILKNSAPHTTIPRHTDG